MATAEQMVANAKEVKIKKNKLLNVCEFHGRWSDLRPWLCGIYSFQLELFLFVSKTTVVGCLFGNPHIQTREAHDRRGKNHPILCLARLQSR